MSRSMMSYLCLRCPGGCITILIPCTTNCVVEAVFVASNFIYGHTLVISPHIFVLKGRTNVMFARLIVMFLVPNVMQRRPESDFANTSVMYVRAFVMRTRAEARW